MVSIRLRPRHRDVRAGLVQEDEPVGQRTFAAGAEAAVAANRQILVFPEGTRRAPDAAPDYKSGATALYLKLKVPCVPFALNSGLFWPRRRLLRRPGTIVVEFLPAIPPGLPRKEFERRLVEAIEPATARLVAQARREFEGTRGP